MRRAATERTRRSSSSRPAGSTVAVAVALAFTFTFTPAAGGPTPPAPAPEAQFPKGFRSVKWSMSMKEVKNALAGEDQGTGAGLPEGGEQREILEVERLEDCPTRQEKPCLTVIARPGQAETLFKEAEYFFNPFNEKILRIVIKYKIEYADIDRQFAEMWGAPASEKKGKAQASSFLPEGQTVERTWRKERTEVNLHYTVYPGRSSVGYVEYVDTEERNRLDFLVGQYEKLGEERRPAEKKQQPQATPGQPLF